MLGVGVGMAEDVWVGEEIEPGTLSRVVTRWGLIGRKSNFILVAQRLR